MNLDKGFVWRREDWQWLPGALEALAAFNRLGLKTVVVTNQSGVARGMYGEDDVRRLHRWAAEDAAARGARIDAFYYCPHLEGCDCRKPLPGMLKRAAVDLDLDLPGSYMIGDRARDAEAGLAVGAASFLIGDRLDALPAGAAAAADIMAACGVIEARESAGRRG